MQYETVIGLEVHIQLNLSSKLFAADSCQTALPNTNVSAVTLGHPGTLPVVNSKAFEFATKLGIALKCDIEQKNFFDRKHYFYPDLPKGYQITQHRTPVCRGGSVMVRKNNILKEIAIHHIHLEEDAGKSLHDEIVGGTCIDLNRAGTALLELVTEPVITSPEEAAAFLSTIRKIVRHLGICNGNMEEGNLRCDANVSLRPAGNTELGVKTEIKNLNSVRFLQKALQYEINRHEKIILRGESPVQESRSYDSRNDETTSMRDKENAHDYRYLPDPDLPPFIITEQFIEKIKRDYQPLPEEIISRYILEFGLSLAEAEAITDDINSIRYFEELCCSMEHKKAANWLLGPLKALCNLNGISIADFPIQSDVVAEVVTMVDSQQITYSVAINELLPILFESKRTDPLEIAMEHSWLQKDADNELSDVINKVINDNPNEVESIRKGKKALIGFFMGEVMKKTEGLYSPALVKKLLIEKLNNN